MNPTKFISMDLWKKLTWAAEKGNVVIIPIDNEDATAILKEIKGDSDKPYAERVEALKAAEKKRLRLAWANVKSADESIKIAAEIRDFDKLTMTQEEYQREWGNQG